MAVGGILGADPEGLVFPRNTTEAMSFVAQGLDLEPGAEILTTDHEHIGGLCPWQAVSRRRGFPLRILSLPVPARSPEELLRVVEEGLSAETRVLSLSQVTFTNGTRLPVERIAELCREREITFVVDGAHPPGMMALDLSSWRPDFYASSPHKWLLAPQGTGLLYLGEAWRTRLWPTLASGGWDDLDLGAQRFNHLGTFDESRMAGLLASVEFLNMLGMERVEARVRYLRGRLQAALERLPGVRRGHAGPGGALRGNGLLHPRRAWTPWSFSATWPGWRRSGPAWSPNTILAGCASPPTSTTRPEKWTGWWSSWTMFDETGFLSPIPMSIHSG